MQWFRTGKAEDPAEFWRAVEARRGGPVGFFSFATLLGKSDGSRQDLPGLLYTVNDAGWFEDFEKDNWLARILTGSRKFEKTEFSFSLGEVAEIRMVTRRAAARCLARGIRPDRLARASALSQFFSIPVVALMLQNGSAIFFDLLKRREFVEMMAGRGA